MKKHMSITGAVSYLNYDGRQAAIPHGPCTVDYGAQAGKLVIVSWRRRELLFAIEMDSAELAGHVAGARVGAGALPGAPTWSAKTVRNRAIQARPVPKCARLA